MLWAGRKEIIFKITKTSVKRSLNPNLNINRNLDSRKRNIVFQNLIIRGTGRVHTGSPNNRKFTYSLRFVVRKGCDVTMDIDKKSQ